MPRGQGSYLQKIAVEVEVVSGGEHEEEETKVNFSLLASGRFIEYFASMHSSSSVCVNEENSDTIFSASFMSSGLGSSSEKGGKIGKQLPQTFDR